MTPRRSALLVLVGASLFGTIGTAQALGPDVPVPALAAVRLLGAAALFWLVALAHGRASYGSLLRRWPTWAAGIGQAAFNLTFLGAVSQVGVAVGTLVAIGTAPLITGLVSRQTSLRWWGSTLVAVVGLTLLLAGGADDAPLSVAGVALAFGAAASYATYILAVGSAERSRLPTSSFLATAFTISALTTAPLLATYPLGWVATREGFALVAYLAIVPTILAYHVFNRGLRGVRPSTASTLALAEPVVAAVLAFAVVGERLGWTGVLGAGLILAGLTLVVRATVGPPPGVPEPAGPPR